MKTKRWSRQLVTVVMLLVAFVLTGGSCLLAVEPACVWSNVERIVAVGDVHGDYGRLAEVLQAAGVIDSTNGWRAGRTHLVQMGDVLGRGPDSRRALDLLRLLEKQAAAVGGAVHALIGNHEAMVMSGEYSYLHPGEIESFGGQEEFEKAFAPDGEYGRWILTHNAVIRINDVLFVHGGLPPSFKGRSLLEMNVAIRADLMDPKDGNPAVMNSMSPLWYRGLCVASEDAPAEEMTRFLNSFGANWIVVGHTVARGGIRVAASGRVIMVDVGLSRYYVNGPLRCLVIEGGRMYEVGPGFRKEIGIAGRNAKRAREEAAAAMEAVGHGRGN